MHVTASVCPVVPYKFTINLLIFPNLSQILIVLSYEEEAKYLPSGEKQTSVTRSSCPSRFYICPRF